MSVRQFSLTIAAATIQNLRTTSVTQTTIAIAWDAYPGATAYQVYRSTTQGSLGTLVLTPTATTYSNSGHTAGTTYYYTVRPVVGGSGVASASASIVVVTVSAGTTPSITTASLVGSTLTIGGANFGVKTSPAPFFFQPFTNVANGATPAAAGFDSWINRGGEAVTLADGVGGGSLRCDPGAANNAFPHIGKYLPANTLEFRLSFYLKLYGNAPSLRQLKFVRAGVRSGSDPTSDYAIADAKFYPSAFVYAGAVYGDSAIQALWRDRAGTVSSYYPEDSGAGGVGIPLASQPDVNAAQWVFTEVHYKFNDVGSSNGVFRAALDGFVWHNRTIVSLRTLESQYIGYVQPVPSIDLIDPTEYDYAMSRVYIDVGPQSVASVFLSNSATLAGVTQKFLLAPSAWEAGSITANNAANIPTGYRYAYVTSPTGETNSAGFLVSGL